MVAAAGTLTIGTKPFFATWEGTLPVAQGAEVCFLPDLTGARGSVAHGVPGVPESVGGAQLRLVVLRWSGFLQRG